jgi:hypothetical protein
MLMGVTIAKPYSAHTISGFTPQYMRWKHYVHSSVVPIYKVTMRRILDETNIKA